LRIVFLGSGEFSGLLLENTIKGGLQFETVVTRPDHRAGRGLRLKPTPVKEIATKKGLQIMQPQNPTEEKFATTLSKLQPDFLLVADYGHILPRNILELPIHGCINIHPSLLPLYRGASPIQRALLDGASTTGVTMMLMDEGLDTGPIISQIQITIEEDDNAGCLREKLALAASRIVVIDLPLFALGQIETQSQNEAIATYAEPIDKSELAIDWSQDNRTIHNQIRALSPLPGAYTYLRGKRIKILRSILENSGKALEIGRIHVEKKGAFIVSTGSGGLRIESLQPEGKKIMSASEFLRGYKLQTGEGFTSLAV
jgi:methionyl-tRNA formyltransferase